jgi:hypothetical protein
MVAYTGVDPVLLRQIGDDVRQLTHPVHIAVGRRVVTHPGFLDQLRDATRPGAVLHGPLRHVPPGSAPPANLAAVDALSTIYVELGGWHARLNHPSPPRVVYGCPHHTCQAMLGDRRGPLCPAAKATLVDWQKHAMRQLVGAAPTLAPQVAQWLATDVHDWWTLAALHSGWRIRDCLNVR